MPRANDSMPPSCRSLPPTPLTPPCNARVAAPARPSHAAPPSSTGAPCSSPVGWSPRTPWCGVGRPGRTPTTRRRPCAATRSPRHSHRPAA
eukprot:3977995-Prymnesium_polylepis.1